VRSYRVSPVGFQLATASLAIHFSRACANGVGASLNATGASQKTHKALLGPPSPPPDFLTFRNIILPSITREMIRCFVSFCCDVHKPYLNKMSRVIITKHCDGKGHMNILECRLIFHVSTF
jgi:hypothetical protein